MLELKFTLLKEEVWKEIIDFENLYLISNKGRIAAKSQKAKAEGQKFFDKVLEIKPNPKSGYCQVKLWRDSSYVYKSVHRLVGEYFIPTDVDISLMQINHKDGIKHNNESSNLEWSTPKENNAHAIRIGLKTNDGNKHSQPHARPVVQVDRLTNKKVNEYPSVREAARLLQIYPQNIRTVCKGRRPTYKGYKWVFKDQYQSE